MAFALGHDVHAEIHSVNKINVGKTRRAEHDLVARRQSARRMCSEVVRPKIRLGFDNSPDALDAMRFVDEKFSEQFLRDDNRVAVVKCATLLAGEAVGLLGGLAAGILAASLAKSFLRARSPQ